MISFLPRFLRKDCVKSYRSLEEDKRGGDKGREVRGKKAEGGGEGGREAEGGGEGGMKKGRGGRDKGRERMRKDGDLRAQQHSPNEREHSQLTHQAP